ncbi:MAG: AI-2E family transporter [Pseudomonadota bacterium]|nr:AI-2E family transporter [Pseudomonadota bacterium]
MAKKNVDGQRYMLILCVFVICGGFLYALRSVLLPFVVGIVLAYFLDPLVSKVSKDSGTSRTVATTVVMGLSLLVLLPMLILLGSAVFSQAAEYALKLPEYVRAFVQKIMPLAEELKNRFGLNYGNLESMLQENMSNYLRILGKVVQSIVANGFAFINVLSLLLISPVVAFYMLRDWHKFVAKIYELIPHKHKQSLLEGMHEVNRIISGYLRGQALVCVCLGSYYSLGLWLVGLDMGVLVGFLAGLISFIPYVGSISGFLMAMALVITQYGTFPKIAAVLVVFGIGQFVEGNFLTPKLVGENIGLHPVWVMFALLAGGVLLGLLGMIIAVPCAAIIGVLLKYLIKHYKQSPMYLEA